MQITNNGVSFEVKNPKTIESILRLIMSEMKGKVRTHTIWTKEQHSHLKELLEEETYSFHEIAEELDKSPYAVSARSYKFFPELVKDLTPEQRRI